MSRDIFSKELENNYIIFFKDIIKKKSLTSMPHPRISNLPKLCVKIKKNTLYLPTTVFNM